MKWIMLFFIIVPILEMVLLIEIGGLVGVIPTIALVLLTAVIGVNMLRQQGFKILADFQSKLGSGEIPGNELLAAVLLLISGAFLLTPGFFTDAVGFAFLVPAIRLKLSNYLINKGLMEVLKQNVQVSGASYGDEIFTSEILKGKDYKDVSPGPSPAKSRSNQVIEGEFISKDEG